SYSCAASQAADAAALAALLPRSTASPAASRAAHAAQSVAGPIRACSCSVRGTRAPRGTAAVTPKYAQQQRVLAHRLGDAASGTHRVIPAAVCRTDNRFAGPLALLHDRITPLACAAAHALHLFARSLLRRIKCTLHLVGKRCGGFGYVLLHAQN